MVHIFWRRLCKISHIINQKWGESIMPKFKSYDKESSDESYLIVSLTWAILITVVTVFLVGVFSL
ncbi:MAG: hypothetical protein CMI23_10280 [Opitutae bacterium]|nr:hypothetical protein [Opitutae bacterium]|tara:strand:+ start:69 stop:263 length:195 start_codon:yes stop_codon:yes gene_type:complete